MGQKAYEPTAANRGYITALASFGFAHEDMAFLLKIDRKTLHKYFAEEIRAGKHLATASVARNVYLIASGKKGKPSDQLAAGKYWLDRFMPAPAPALENEDLAERRFEMLPEEELHRIAALARPRLARPGARAGRATKGAAPAPRKARPAGLPN